MMKKKNLLEEYKGLEMDLCRWVTGITDWSL